MVVLHLFSMLMVICCSNSIWWSFDVNPPSSFNSKVGWDFQEGVRGEAWETAKFCWKCGLFERYPAEDGESWRRLERIRGWNGGKWMEQIEIVVAVVRFQLLWVVFFCFVLLFFVFISQNPLTFVSLPLHGQDRRLAARSLPKRWHGAAARTVRHQKEGNPILGLETSGTWTRWPIPSEGEKVHLWVDGRKTEVPCESMYFLQKLGISRFYAMISLPEGKTKQQCFNR